MNNIVRRFADPDAILEIRSEQLVAIRSDAVAGGECVYQVGPVETLERFANREDARGVRIISERLAR